MIAAKRWVILAGMTLVGISGTAGLGRGGLTVQAPTPASATASAPLAAAATGGPRTAYTIGTAPLRRDPGGTVVGTLTPGTPVSITETRGADVRVDVQGWSAGEGTAVLIAMGQRVILVNLSARDQVQRQVGAQTKDSYGTVWTQVTISGWVAVNALTADVQAVWMHGRLVYEAHCSTCHSLYATAQYSANQWPGVVQSMADRSNLAGDDLALVMKYLQMHAKTP